jgi:hypothetical protein
MSTAVTLPSSWIASSSGFSCAQITRGVISVMSRLMFTRMRRDSVLSEVAFGVG